MGEAQILSLKIGIAFDYDHLRDIRHGLVQVPGLALDWVDMPLLEALGRRREWDVAEVPLGGFTQVIGSGDRSLVGIPVFPSRVFRHGAIYVRKSSQAERPSDLERRRVGLPYWAQTAAIYARGVLEHEYGVDLHRIQWVQGGLEAAGVANGLPEVEAFDVRTEQSESLGSLLMEGALDAVMAAHPPEPWWSNGELRPLIADAYAEEVGYFRRTGVFPIMHLLVARREVIESDSEVMQALVDGFAASRDACFRRLLMPGVSMLPVPWLAAQAPLWWKEFGAEWWPYGLASNLATLETFLAYAHEQCISPHPLAIDDVFPFGPAGGS